MRSGVGRHRVVVFAGGVAVGESRSWVMTATLGGGAVVVVFCGCEWAMGLWWADVFSGLGWAADPFLEGLLDLDRRQGRPSGAGFAGRFAVLDSGPDREKIWLAIGAAARVWRSGILLGTGEVDGVEGWPFGPLTIHRC